MKRVKNVQLCLSGISGRVGWGGSDGLYNSGQQSAARISVLYWGNGLELNGTECANEKIAIARDNNGYKGWVDLLMDER